MYTKHRLLTQPCTLPTEPTQGGLCSNLYTIILCLQLGFSLFSLRPHNIINHYWTLLLVVLQTGNSLHMILIMNSYQNKEKKLFSTFPIYTLTVYMALMGFAYSKIYKKINER